MAYVMVSRETTKRANELRRAMLQEAIDTVAGRSTKEKFDATWSTFLLCWDPYQPRDDDAEWLLERLKDFYCVSWVSSEVGSFTVTYRHESLPRRKRCTPLCLDGYEPVEVRLDDVSNRDDGVDATAIKHISGITDGPFHLTVVWEAKK